MDLKLVQQQLDGIAVIRYEIGKKQAGRLLDGVEWNQMPGESSR